MKSFTLTVSALAFFAVQTLLATDFLGPGWHSPNNEDQPLQFIDASAPEAQAGALQTFALAGAQTAGASNFTQAPQPDEQTTEIVELARGLRNDKVLIYNYVKNNIKYQPYYGTLKGATQTLLERSGNDFDQAALLVALLRASGYTANYKYGLLQLPFNDPSKEDITHWLGCDERTSVDVIRNGGIPIGFVGTSDGTSNGIWLTLQVYRVWVELQDGGITYTLDPAFKPSEKVAGIDLAAAMGYSQSAFLSSAGGTTTATSVQNLNRPSIESDLATLAGNLIQHIRSNSANATVKEIVGGYEIIQNEVEALPTSFPPSITVSSTDHTWTESNPIPSSYFTSVTFQSGRYQTSAPNHPDFEESAPFFPKNGVSLGLDYTIPTHALSGQKVSLTFEGASQKATLRLDDVLVQEEAGTITGDSVSFRIYVNHPYESQQGTYQDQGEIKRYLRVGTYSILYGFGGSDTGELLKKRNRKLDELRAQGLDDSSREVLSEALFATGLEWLKQTKLGDIVNDNLSDIQVTTHHRFGRVGQEYNPSSGQGGYYVDVGLQHISFNDRQESQSSQFAGFRAALLYASAMEHAVIEQLQDNTSASTIKVITKANEEFSERVYHINSISEFDSLRPTLSSNGYPSALLDSLRASLFTESRVTYLDGQGNPYDQIQQLYGLLILPERYSYSVDSWDGTGYIDYHQRIYTNVPQGAPTPLVTWPNPPIGLPSDIDTQGNLIWSFRGISQGMIINGNYGGFAGTPAPLYTSPIVDHYQSDPFYFNYEPPSLYNPISDEPVDLATGAYLYENVDIDVGLTEPRGIKVIRSYNSNKNRDVAALGPGWTHNYAGKIATRTATDAGLGGSSPIDAASFITGAYVALDLLQTPSGAKDWVVASLVSGWATDQLKDNARAVIIGDQNFQFIRLPDGSFNPPAGIATELVEESGNYSLGEQDGSQVEFERVTISGETIDRLKKIVDVDGNELTLSYHGDGRLQTVSDATPSPNSRTLTFHYNGDLIDRIEDSTGRNVYYGYDVDGNLEWFQDPAGAASKWYYEYDDEHRMLAPKNPSGERLTFNTYDELGRVKQQKSQDLAGHVWDFYYSGFATVEVNPLGNSTTYYFDDKGRQVGIKDGEGNKTTKEYDGQNHVIRSVDARGQATEFEYESNYFGPNGLSTGANHNLLKVYPYPDTDPSVFTRSDYDDNNRVTDVYDEGSNHTEYEYKPGDVAYRPIKVIRHRDKEPDVITEYQYYASGDAKGLLEWEIDPNGNKTYYTYDIYGQLDKVRRAVADGTTGDTPATRYSEADYNYTSRGDLNELFDERGFWSSRAYNTRRQLTNLYRGQGIASSRQYDIDGHLDTSTASDGTVVDFEYDSFSRLTDTTYPGLSTDIGARTVKQVYDRGDRMDTVTDALGRTVDYGYDAAGRRTSEANPMGETYNFGFDANGNVTSVTNPRGFTKWMTYNERNQLLTENRYGNWGDYITYNYDDPNDKRPLLWQVTDFTGDLTTFTYDELGRVESMTDDEGTIAWQYNYGLEYVTGKKGLRVVVTETPTAGGSKVVAKNYDEVGRLFTFQANGFATYYSYYENDLLHQLSYPGGRVVTYEYDDANRLIRVVDGANITTFTYHPHTDPVGQRQKLHRITFPNGCYQEYLYRSNGEPWVLRDRKSDGSWIRDNILLFDRGGQLVGEILSPRPTDFKDSLGPAVSESSSYDGDNRLSATNSASSLSFDDDGNMLNGPLPGGTTGTAFTYDVRNRLTSAGGASYVYGPENRRWSRAYNGETTSFMTVPLFGRDEVIRQTRTGHTTDFIYAPGHGLLYQVTNGTMVVYHTDTRGHTVALTDENEDIVSLVEYTPFGTMLGHVNEPLPDSETFPFLFNGSYGVMAEPNGLLYMRARYYHPSLRRFINPDPIGDEGGYNHYLFANGNPVMFNDPLGLKVGDWWDVWANLSHAEKIGNEQLAAHKGHNDLGDAMRHSTWNQRMVEEIGPVTAFMVGTGYELKDNILEPILTEEKISPIDEILMDLHNNHEGRSAASQGRPISQSNLRTLETTPGDYEYIRNRETPPQTDSPDGIYSPSQSFSPAAANKISTSPGSSILNYSFQQGYNRVGK